ncbi:hypothetical protein AMECASPLE_007938 [Ameca splendens]|uniref:Uncharacterized protein n=1 Tax=Ameca splendens TaxID=208324 RepID=A0ABV0Z9C5_9TELE
MIADSSLQPPPAPLHSKKGVATSPDTGRHTQLAVTHRGLQTLFVLLIPRSTRSIATAHLWLFDWLLRTYPAPQKGR